MKKRIKRFFSKIGIFLKTTWYRHKITIIVGLLIFAFILAYFWNNIFISIYPGHAGVLWKRFHSGTVIDKVYGEGLHVILPWDRMYVYSLRIQETHESIRILTSAGLYVEMDISYRFHPDRKNGLYSLPESPDASPTAPPIISPAASQTTFQSAAPVMLPLPLLHKLWGPEYAAKFVKPEAKAAAIAVLGNYSRQKLHSLRTTDIQEEIETHLDKEFDNSHIVLHDFLITRLKLPKTISDAIEKKLTQEQLLQEYSFKLEVEARERDRKAIEAMGINLFQQISGIPILRWKGLDVTSEIARSNNAKVVVIGTGANGLPIILNADK